MSSQLKTLYEELGRSFFSKPSDLKKCVAILSKLKVRSLFTSFTHFCSFSQDRAHRGWFTSSSRRHKSWGPCCRSFVSNCTELPFFTYPKDFFQVTSLKSEHCAASEAATFPHSIGTFLNYRPFTQITGLSFTNEVSSPYLNMF